MLYPLNYGCSRRLVSVPTPAGLSSEKGQLARRVPAQRNLSRPLLAFYFAFEVSYFVRQYTTAFSLVPKAYLNMYRLVMGGGCGFGQGFA